MVNRRADRNSTDDWWLVRRTSGPARWRQACATLCRSLLLWCHCNSWVQFWKRGRAADDEGSFSSLKKLFRSMSLRWNDASPPCAEIGSSISLVCWAECVTFERGCVFSFCPAILLCNACAISSFCDVDVRWYTAKEAFDLWPMTDCISRRENLLWCKRVPVVVLMEWLV